MNTSGGFTAFSSSAADQVAGEVAEVRRQSTSDERTVLALEGISDQLMLIHADLTSIDEFARSGSCAEEAETSSSTEAEVRSQHNARDQYQVTSGHPEILRSLHYRFSVWGYKYTDLQHAISEAKRVRRAGLAEETAKVHQ
jgi:hypothetical protein